VNTVRKRSERSWIITEFHQWCEQELDPQGQGLASLGFMHSTCSVFTVYWTVCVQSVVRHTTSVLLAACVSSGDCTATVNATVCQTAVTRTRDAVRCPEDRTPTHWKVSQSSPIQSVNRVGMTRYLCIFVFHCTHVRMLYVLNSYLLTYLLRNMSHHVCLYEYLYSPGKFGSNKKKQT